MNDLLLFKVEQIGNAIKITNNSQFNLLLHLMPIKPKRKIVKFCIIPRDSWQMHDYDFDLSRIFFSLEIKGEKDG